MVRRMVGGTAAGMAGEMEMGMVSDTRCPGRAAEAASRRRRLASVVGTSSAVCRRDRAAETASRRGRLVLVMVSLLPLYRLEMVWATHMLQMASHLE